MKGLLMRVLLPSRALMLSLCIPATGIAQITFGNPAYYPVGPAPTTVVTGDFNGDGKLDLAVANADWNATGNDIVSILLGNGDGTFQPAVNYSVGLNPISITVVDLNLDNKQDLAVAFHGLVSGNSNSNQTGGVSLLLGNGDGTFQPMASLASSDFPQGIVVGDFNGDHKPDLAISNIDASVSVFLGNGDGTLRRAGTYPVTGDPGRIGVGDFNGDGKQDLVVGTNGGGCGGSDCLNGFASVLLGNGDGTFRAAIETNLGGAAGVGAIGDFNGDGRLDLAYTFRTNVFDPGHILTILGNGDGTFAGGGAVDDGSFRSHFVTGADLNNDGTPDLLALGSFPGAARVWLGKGDGTFQLAQTVVFNSGVPQEAAIGDFNGDQLPDFAVTMGVTSPPGVVAVVLNTTTGFTISASALTPPTVTPGQSATSNLTLGAANGFTGSISFSCAVQPQPALAPQCSVSPVSADPGTQVMLTVTTTRTQASSNLRPHRSGLIYALWLPLCGLTLMGTVTTVRRERRRLWFILVMVMLIGDLATQVACATGSPQQHDFPGTPKGQYTIGVTGTSGSAHHSTTVALTVQ